MTIENAEFAVRHSGTLFKCKGSELTDKLQDGDLMAVQRAGVTRNWESTPSNLDKIQDDDLFACTDEDGVTKKVTGARFKTLFGPLGPPWEEEVGIYHVILANPSDISLTDESKIYNLNTEQEVSSITGAGEWIITGANTRFMYSTGNWDFGHLTDTSKVTNMGMLFYNAKAFNSDISIFDTSKVTYMTRMFYSATVFNQDISGFDVSKVTKMADMFNYAEAFNSDISGWDVSNVKTMYMFLYKTKAFNQDIGGWNVSNVSNMHGTVLYSSAFNQNLSKWCVSKIPSMNLAYFNQGSAMPTDGSYNPVWGTCP